MKKKKNSKALLERLKTSIGQFEYNNSHLLTTIADHQGPREDENRHRPEQDVRSGYSSYNERYQDRPYANATV